MKEKNAGSYLSTKVKKSLCKFFDKSFINRIGRSSGFMLGKVQKISPYNFVVGFLLCCLHLHNTYHEWARQITALSTQPLSRQGLWERISKRSEIFARTLLEKLLLKKTFTKVKAGLFNAFKRVLLQDSTCLHLPDRLSCLFKGPKAKGVQQAIARIQSVIEIKKMEFLHFCLGAYNENDQGASPSILAYIRRGDLIIRDLGYFSLAVFDQIRERGAHFLSRLKYGVKLYDYFGREIDIAALLAKRRKVDRWVYAGKEQKVWVRLLLIPLPKEQAAERIRRARERADRRYTQPQAYYQWFSYNIYITSVEAEVWSREQVDRAYGVRWNIEIIFKSWKSGFHLQGLLTKNCAEACRVRTNIYLLLLFICLFMQKVYIVYRDKVERESGQIISVLKLSAFIFENFVDMLCWSPQKLEQQLLLHCCYEKRKDRTNMIENLNFINHAA